LQKYLKIVVKPTLVWASLAQTNWYYTTKWQITAGKMQEERL
jgi:hypothetical protein